MTGDQTPGETRLEVKALLAHEDLLRSPQFSEMLDRVSASLDAQTLELSFEEQVRRIAADIDWKPAIELARGADVSARPALIAVVERLKAIAVKATEPAAEQVKGQLDGVLEPVQMQIEGVHKTPAEGNAVKDRSAQTLDAEQLARKLGTWGGVFFVVFSYITDALDIDSVAHRHALAMCITITLFLMSEAAKSP